MAFQDFDHISERRRREKQQKLRKKITIAVVVTLVLLIIAAAAVCVLIYKQRQDGSSKGKKQAAQSQKAVKMICAGTDYKKTCEDHLAQAVGTNASTSQPKYFLKAALSVAEVELGKASNQISKLKFDTPEKKGALEDCMQLFKDAVEEFNSSAATVDAENVGKVSLRTSDLNTWLSAIMSYQQTCIDGVPGEDLKSEMKKVMQVAKELTSNALATVAEMSAFLSSFTSPSAHRHLLSTSSLDADGFPAWVYGEERRLLKAHDEITPNVIVAKDGSGNFTSISKALAAMPEKRPQRYIIYIKEGVYDENVIVGRKMVNITMVGDGAQKTIIKGNKNYKDGVRVLHTATFAAIGEGFVAQSIGFRNTAGPEKHEAVALRVQSDRSVFLNCHVEGYQNTLYVQTHRQFYRGCLIKGTVDIIFGDAAAIFQNCMIYVRRPLENQQNVVVAQGRVDRRETTGTVLQNCHIQADDQLEAQKSKFKSYLGRPWREFSRTIIMETEIEDLIHPEGWQASKGELGYNTAYLAEYNNKGKGAGVSGRVKWPGHKLIKKEEAKNYTTMGFTEFEVGKFVPNPRWTPINFRG